MRIDELTNFLIEIIIVTVHSIARNDDRISTKVNLPKTEREE